MYNVKEFTFVTLMIVINSATNKRNDRIYNTI